MPRIGRVVTPSSCVLVCRIGTFRNIVLLDICLGDGWFRLGMVIVDGDWAVPQQRNSRQPSQIIYLSRLGR